jgi:O-antigen/teichoic acid export membrane protein
MVRKRLVKNAISFLSMSILRKQGATLINQGVVSASNFLTGIFIGRACSKDEFGLYILGFSIVLFVLDLQISLVSTPYMVYSPRLKGLSLRLYRGSSLTHQFALSIIVMLVLMMLGSAASFGFGPPGLASVVWALVVTIGFIMLREFVRRICFADLRMEIAVLFDLSVAAIQIGGLFFLAQRGFLSAVRAYWVIGCACGVASAGWLFLNRAAFKIQVSQAISDIKHNWTFGKWVFASGILWAISMNLYPWFLTFFHGAASAGVWGACLGVLALANVPLVGIQNFVGPKISNVYAEGGKTDLRQFAFKSSLFFCIAMGIMCCAFFLVGDPLLGLLYGNKYIGNGFVVFILALGLVPASVAFSFSRALFAMERADVDFKVNFVALFILFSFGIWFVRSFGPLGAAYGLLMANGAASVVRWVSFAILSRPCTINASR